MTLQRIIAATVCLTALVGCDKDSEHDVRVTARVERAEPVVVVHRPLSRIEPTLQIERDDDDGRYEAELRVDEVIETGDPEQPVVRRELFNPKFKAVPGKRARATLRADEPVQLRFELAVYETESPALVDIDYTLTMPAEGGMLLWEGRWPAVKLDEWYPLLRSRREAPADRDSAGTSGEGPRVKTQRDEIRRERSEAGEPEMVVTPDAPRGEPRAEAGAEPVEPDAPAIRELPMDDVP